MKHELRTLQAICPDRDYGNVCPACPVVGFGCNITVYAIVNPIHNIILLLHSTEKKKFIVHVNC